MSGSIEYRHPTGETIENPPLDKLIRLVTDAPQTDWDAGSGMAHITYAADGGTAALNIIMLEGFGFHLEYYPQANRHEFYLSIGSECFDEFVTVYVSGEPTLLPKGVFISKEAAKSAIQEFCLTGGASTDVVWKRRTEVSWADDEDEYFENLGSYD